MEAVVIHECPQCFGLTINALSDFCVCGQKLIQRGTYYPGVHISKDGLIHPAPDAVTQQQQKEGLYIGGPPAQARHELRICNVHGPSMHSIGSRFTLCIKCVKNPPETR